MFANAASLLACSRSLRPASGSLEILAAAICLSIRQRVGAEVVRAYGHGSARSRVLEDWRQLRLKQRGLKRRKRGRGVSYINGVNGAVAEVLFREEARRTVEIRGEFVGCDSLTKGKRREASRNLLHQPFLNPSSTPHRTLCTFLKRSVVPFGCLQ